MEPRAQPAVAGPVVFFGLAIFTLLSQSPDNTVYANPADTMSMVSIAKTDRPLTLANPFPAFAPPLSPPAAPRRTQLQALPTQGGLDAAGVRTTALAPPNQNLRGLDQVETVQAPGVVSGTNAPEPSSYTDSATLRSRPDPSQPAPLETAYVRNIHEWVEVAGEAVNLRRTPDVSSTSFDQFNSGAKALRVEISGRWSRVTFLDRSPPLSGWMSSQYLTVSQN